MRTTKHRPLALLLASGLVLSACGSSDSSSDSSPDPTEVDPTEQVAEDVESDLGELTDEEASIAEDAIDAALGDVSDECQAVALSFGAAMSSAFGTPEQQSQVADLFGSIEDKAPSDLKDDLELFAEAIASFYDGRDATAEVDPSEFFAALGAPGVAEAAQNIETYLEESCPEFS